MTHISSFRDYTEGAIGLYSFKVGSIGHKIIVAGDALKLPGIGEKVRSALVKLGAFDAELRTKYNNHQVPLPCIIVKGKSMEKHVRNLLSTGEGLGGVDVFKREVEHAKKGMSLAKIPSVTVEDEKLEDESEPESNQPQKEDSDKEEVQVEQPKPASEPEQKPASKSRPVYHQDE